MGLEPEREKRENALEASHHNCAQAAGMLGISRSTLYDK